MHKTKDNLVIAVSLDSSLEMLEKFADVVVLDKHISSEATKKYKTVYIRSHFSTPGYTPQDFRAEIDNLINQARQHNSDVVFIDNMFDVDEIVNFEDKFSQYKLFGDFMPRTEIYKSTTDVSSFTRPIFKKRLSSRGQGVTWDATRADPSNDEWLVQESLDINEELRVYIVKGEVCPTATVRQNMTEGIAVQAIDSRNLTDDELTFATEIAAKRPDLDMIGLDIAMTPDGKQYLMEVNRSPGFAKFHALTGIDLATELYAESSKNIRPQ